MTDVLAFEAEGFRRAFHDAPIGMALVAVDGRERGRFLRVNRAMCEVTGYSESELLDSDFQRITHPDDVQSDLDRMDELLSGEVDTYQLEKRYRHANHHSVWVLVTASLVRDAEGHPLYAIRQIQDINARKLIEGQMEYLADNDPLTGLFNRRRFAREVSHQLDYARRYGGGGTLLAIDLDHLKLINDRFGHSGGDQLIAACARLLADRSRSSDVVGRLGGDEFAVSLPNTDLAQATAWAEGFLTSLENDHGLQMSPLPPVGASVGIAAFDDFGEATAADIQICADLAMYQAKRSGGRRVAVYGPELERGTGEPASDGGRLTWSARIKHALRDDGFVLYAQPILDLKTDTVAQSELLLRLPLDNGEVVLPSAFIYSAERFGLVCELDRWVIAHALDRAAARTGRTLAINLSADSVSDPGLCTFVREEIERRGVDPQRLVFEITETAVISNMAIAQRTLTGLVRLGAQVALDDFGAGFGSFHHLKQLPLQFLKIDGEFIRNLPASRTDRIFVRSMVNLARDLGQRTIAEHVENQPTLDLVRELGVDMAQGNFVGAAKPLE